MAESTATQLFTLAPAPPVRPLAAAAALTLIGAGLLVMGAVADRAVAVAIGTVLLTVGLALTGLGWLFWRRLRFAVALNASGLTVRRGRRTRSLRWEEISEVSATPLRLTLVPRSGRRLVVVSPQRSTAPILTLLADAIRERLDADRGYRSVR
ncbi:MAG: PH domain-containing protein [Actinomycetes bacterium]